MKSNLRYRRRLPLLRRIGKALAVLLASVGTLTLIAGLVAAGWLLSAWWLMLGVGIAHRDWWPAVPTMSYHVALILVLFFGAVLSPAAAFHYNRKGS